MSRRDQVPAGAPQDARGAAEHLTSAQPWAMSTNRE